MIPGSVNDALEATIPLTLEKDAGDSQPVEAVIDTGFNGFLTLPPARIAALGLRWLCRQRGFLADGSVQVFDVYEAVLQWDGRTRKVEVESVDAEPLVGMAMLERHELRIQVISGGAVTVQELS